MAGRSNKDKDKDLEIDKILDETPPDISEPITKDEEESEIAQDAIRDPENEEPKDEADEKLEEEIKPAPVEKEEVKPAETPEQKEQRYKAQQTEAQIQAERNRVLLADLEKAGQVTDPTIEELKVYVGQDGVSWDELTTFEQSMAKKTYLSDKRSQALSQVVESTKKVDEYAKVVDDFIDSTDGKPEYVELSSHEADFRKYAMKDSHRGAPIDVLLAAFLHNLPPVQKKRGSLFETGSGGDKVETKTGMTDADEVANLRKNNPREYARQLKAGKIKLEV